MSSPNDPSRLGPDARPGPGEGSADIPPWQGGARRDEPVGRPAASRDDSVGRHGVPREDAPVRPATPPSGNPRASRYVTGLAAPDLSAMGSVPQRPAPAAPPTRPESSAERTEVNAPVNPAGGPPEGYSSELPDLSGAAPKPVPRRPPTEAPARALAPTPGPPSAATPVPALAPKPAPMPRVPVAGRARGPVRASMQVRYIDPWSTLRVAGLLSVALFFVWMIAVAFLYLVLGAMGVWSKLNSNVGDLLTSGSGGGGEIVSAGSIFGGAALIGLVNIVLLTAMATVGAYIYNLSTDIVGGVEVTLADLD